MSKSRTIGDTAEIPPHWRERFLSWWFAPGEEKTRAGAPWAFGGVLVLLFLMGLAHWIVFFNAGRLEFTAYDWPKEISYLRVIQEAVGGAKLPLYINQPFQGTDKFLGLPETLMSPQILLLKFMPVERFAMANILVLYTAGFAGLLLLHRRFRFTPFAFVALFLLFNFNGYITARMAVGHFMWSGCFLLPFFVESVFGAMASLKPGLRWSSLSALALTAILFQGAFHLWTWCLMLMLFLGVANRPLRNYALGAILLSGLLGAVRLLPGIVCLSGRQNRFLSGYPTLTDFVSAFIQQKTHLDSIRGGFFGKLGVGWWEFDIFVGLAGFAFLLYYGVYRRNVSGATLRARELDVPLVALIFLAIADSYALFAFSHLPFSDVERVSARFIIVPFNFVLVLACARSGKVMTALSSGWRWMLLLLALVTTQELLQHSYHWRIADIEAALREGTIHADMPSAASLGAHIVTGNDHTYERVLVASAALSGVALIACLWLMLPIRKLNQVRPA